MGLLHIYASETCHDDTWVVGDREALLALRDTIDLALKGQEFSGETVHGAAVEAWTADGEGFAAIVRVVETNTDLSLPYSESTVVNRVGTHPMQLGHYRNLWKSRKTRA